MTHIKNVLVWNDELGKMEVKDIPFSENEEREAESRPEVSEVITEEEQLRADVDYILMLLDDNA